MFAFLGADALNKVKDTMSEKVFPSIIFALFPSHLQYSVSQRITMTDLSIPRFSLGAFCWLARHQRYCSSLHRWHTLLVASERWCGLSIASKPWHVASCRGFSVCHYFTNQSHILYNTCHSMQHKSFTHSIAQSLSWVTLHRPTYTVDPHTSSLTYLPSSSFVILTHASLTHAFLP